MRQATVYILFLLLVGIAYAATRPAVSPRLVEAQTASADTSGYVPLIINEEVVPDTLAPGFTPGRLVHGVTRIPADSTYSDTSRTQVSRFVRTKVDLDNAVDFTAADSLVLIGRDRAYMYGNSTVRYGEINLNAGRIEMSMDSATVFASASPVDSLVESKDDKTEDYPVFSDGSGEYQSRTMRYNFRTERGFITDVVTEQGEGFLTGARTKKMDDGSFNLEGARYTTCDDHEHPHFYFQVTRGKMRPKKNIVTGPVYLVLADVPLPLALPFGFFPFSEKYSSGIIVPSFGDDYNRGFYLRDGGYYFAINDNVDLALRGEIYTRGSWGLSAHSQYVKRYRYRGLFDISYITTIMGDKGDPDYSKQNNFKIAWTHSQDAKANPNLSFSAAVDFTTSGYTRNDLNSYYSSAFTENTKSSSVNLTYRFPQSKWSVSATASVAQRTQDSTLAVSFPNFTVTMSQTNPFRRRKAVGAERWYEKIRLSYSAQFQNSLTARQDLFFKKSLLKDWRNAMKHYLPVSATFSIFKYINISPAITINDRMYTSKIRRSWDPAASAEVRDTTYGFYNVFDFNASVSLDTKIYGFWKPMKFLGDKVQMIRHVMTPTISFSAAPDFGAAFWGIYGAYQRPGADGEMQTVDYNYFEHGLFGTPVRGRQGVLTVSLANNLEMKVRSESDSTGVKKISLIENLQLQQSYNFAADSLNWSNLTASVLLRLTRNFNLNLQTTWDPYTYALSPSGSPVRVNRTRLQAGKGWVKLSSAGTSFSYTINQDTFRKKSGDAGETDNPNDGYGAETGGDEDSDISFAEQAAARRKKNKRDQESTADADGYESWSVPWSLSLNYSVNYGYGDFNRERMEYDGRWTQNLSLSGNIRPTKNWSFSFSASYNFELHRIAYMNCSISRDLHCFTMSASFVPVGPYKSYNFHIAIKSSILKDIKYDKRSSTSNGVTWY